MLGAVQVGEVEASVEAGDEGGVVADAEHRGVVIAADLLDEVHRDGGVLGVEAGGGLVGEDEGGLAGEGAGDGDALLLAQAHVLGEGRRAGDVEFGEEGLGAVVVLFGGDIGEGEGHEDVFESREAVQEVEGLEDDADVSAPEVVAVGAGELVDIAARDADGAGGGFEEAHDEVEEGGLARAGLAGEEDLLGGGDGELRDVEGGGLLARVGEAEVGDREGLGWLGGLFRCWGHAGL